MKLIDVIRLVFIEYGPIWIINRIQYTIKLKILHVFPILNKVFEHSVNYPSRIDLFYIDIDAIKKIIGCLDNSDKTNLIYEADNAIKGTIKGFSSLYLNYGSPLDWQLNPVTGRRCDEKTKWYDILDFDEERGDIKIIWEASRLTHFIHFTRAYLLTGEKKYYSAFSEQLSSWLEKNSYGYGANYKCGQECALRMINTLLAYSVFHSEGIVTDGDESNVKDMVDRCYRRILSNFFYAHRCIKNNHTLSELLGMIVGAWCCQDAQHLQRSFELLDNTIDSQFTEDGGYLQFSFNYQRFALQIIECILSIEEKVNFRLSTGSREKIKKSSLLMYQCQDKTEDMPNYGANDGSLIFPVTSCGYRNFTPVINTTYALISGQQLYSDGKHQEELIWFSGKKCLSEYKSVSIQKQSSQFPKAGIFTLREPKSWAMIIANSFYSRPSHMDQLHFDLWIDGINVFCDLGTYSYASDVGRNLSNTAGHNTVQYNGNNQMGKYGPFMIYNWTKRKRYDFNAAYFEGEVQTQYGYTHKRKVICEQDCYKIIDSIVGKVGHEFSIRLHTPCQVEHNGTTALISQNGRSLCEITFNGMIKIESSMRSLYYMKKAPITCLSVSGSPGNSIVSEIRIH